MNARNINRAKSFLYVVAFGLMIVCGLLSLVSFAIALEQSEARNSLIMFLASGAWFVCAACVCFLGAEIEKALNGALYGNRELQRLRYDATLDGARSRMRSRNQF